MTTGKLALITMLLAAAMTAACQRGTPDATAEPEAAIGVVSGSVTAADGLPVAYDVRGGGDVNLVFVHCWSCNREFWREQLDVFADDYRVVALDLGGHGQSPATRESWSILGLAQDVKAVADELELDNIVLIGHSMGGPVSLEAARLMSGRVIGVIAADTLHDADLKFPPDQAEQMIAAFEADFAGTMASMFAGMAAEGMDTGLRDWIVTKASNANPEVAVALLRDFGNLDFPALFSNAGVPIRAINAMSSVMTPTTNIEGNRKYADFDATLMEDVGHFLQLENPQAFNRLLRVYLQELNR